MVSAVIKEGNKRLWLVSQTVSLVGVNLVISITQTIRIVFIVFISLFRDFRTSHVKPLLSIKYGHAQSESKDPYREFSELDSIRSHCSLTSWTSARLARRRMGNYAINAPHYHRHHHPANFKWPSVKSTRPIICCCCCCCSLLT